MGRKKLRVAGVVVAATASATALVAVAVGGFGSESVTAPSSESVTRGVSSPQAVAETTAPVPATPEPLVLINSYDEGEIVEPDPSFLDELDLASFSTIGWETDFSRHTVPLSEIRSGGPPRDGIPPIDNPKFLTPQESEDFLGDEEPVVALTINDDARAYPLKILTLHEVVNDEVGGLPVTVTFCPLCNSAIVFDFGTSGHLRLSDQVMWDRQT